MIEHIVYHPYPCTVRKRLQIPSQEQHNSITAVQISWWPPCIGSDVSRRAYGVHV